MPLTRAVGYCRFSSEQQRGGYSIEAQEDAIRVYCKAKGYDFLRFYVDEAKTGTKDSRDSFQEMMIDARAGKFDFAVVHKLDRFSRNRYDFAVYRRLLSDAHVRLLSVTEDFDETKPESIMLEGMIEAMAEYYSKNLSRETKKGLYERVRKGLICGSIPIGYKRTDEGRYQIDDALKEIPIEVFRRIASGEQLASVVRDLRGRGIRGRRGGLISHQEIEKIIRNTLYYGTNTFSYGKGDPIVIPDVAPALVAKELWALANQRIHDHDRVAQPRHKIADYPLTGILFCGTCGGHMTGYSHMSRGKKRVSYYRCIRSTNGKCPHCPMLRKETVERAIFEAACRALSRIETASVVADAINAKIKERSSGGEARMAADRLKKIERERALLLDAYLKGAVPLDLYSEKSKKLEIELGLSKAEAGRYGVSKLPKVTAALVGAAFKYYLEKWNEVDDRAGFFSALIEKATVYDDRIEIVYRLPCEVRNGNQRGVQLPLTHLSVEARYSVGSWRVPFLGNGTNYNVSVTL
jgi:site-specific DNA recombinase